MPIKTACRIDVPAVIFRDLKRTDEEKTITVKIQRGDGDPLKPTLVPQTNPNIATTLREVTPGELYELDVTVKPPWPNQPIRGAVMIETGVKEAPREQLIVTAALPARLQAVPAQLRLLPSNPAGASVQARLQWSDNRPGKILSAVGSDARMSVEVQEDGDHALVTLRVPAGYSAARGRAGTITITTDDPEVPTLELPVFTLGSQVGTPPAVRGSTTQPVIRRGRRIEP